jgi:hypothetical protein
MLDASGRPEDADPLHFRTISDPENAPSLIAVIYGLSETPDYTGRTSRTPEIFSSDLSYESALLRIARMLGTPKDGARFTGKNVSAAIVH